MSEKESHKGDEIKATDIVFDCPFCGKSLAIDYRGAGLTVPCTDCGKSVEVPIPDGMDLNDIDATDEEQETRIRNLRKSLQSVQNQVRQLEGDIEQLEQRRRSLEAADAESARRFEKITRDLDAIKPAFDQIQSALRNISEAVKPRV